MFASPLRIGVGLPKLARILVASFVGQKATRQNRSNTLPEDHTKVKEEEKKEPLPDKEEWTVPPC